MSHIYSYVCPLAYSSHVASIPQTCKPYKAEIEEKRDRKAHCVLAGIITTQGDSSFSLNTRIQIEFSPLGLQREDKGKVLFMHESGVPQREKESERGGSW